MKVLVVVDMQHGFNASHKAETITEIIAQIDLARQSEWPIIVLEYTGYEVTHRNILDAAAGYEYFILLRKSDDDGTREIRKALMAFPDWLEAEGFRFVGVNTDACVKHTVLGMAEHFPDHEMEVWLAGCNSIASNEPFGLGNMKNIVFAMESERS